METPIYALTEGTSPILSYNYGARRPSRVKNSGIVMALMVFGYTAIMWSLIILAPGMLIRIFSSDSVLVADAIPALKQYFATDVDPVFSPVVYSYCFRSLFVLDSVKGVLPFWVTCVISSIHIFVYR